MIKITVKDEIKSSDSEHHYDVIRKVLWSEC